MKQNLLEEINKMKMMFSYDNKRTLTENMNIEEQRSALRDLAADTKFVSKNRAELESILSKATGGLKDINGNSLKTAEELTNAISKDLLSPANLGKVNRGLLRSSGVSREVKEAVAKDIGEFMYTKKADYQGATRETMKEALIKQNNYSPEEAEMIVKAYENKGGFIKDGKDVKDVKDLEAAKDLERQKELEKLKEKNKQKDFDRQKELEKLKEKKKQAEFEKMKEQYNVPKDEVGLWKRFKNRIKGVRWGKALLILGGLGLAAYLLYDWFMNDDDVPFPDCLKQKVSKEDWDETIKNNGEYLTIINTGDDKIDSIGGGKFYEGGKFKSGDDSQQGTWSEEGGNIVIKIGSDKYMLNCGSLANPEYDDDLNDNNYETRPCSSFPFTVGCMNSYISDLNECMGLGMGNTFTKELERELIKRGFGNSVDINIYNQIMKLCGKKTIKPSSMGSYTATLDI